MRKLIVIVLFNLLFTVSARAVEMQGDTLLVNKARQAAKAEDFETALALFLQADKTFAPDTTDYYGNLQHNIGYVYYMLGNKPQAAAYWEKSLSVFPQFTEKNKLLLDLLEPAYSSMGDDYNHSRIVGLIEAHNEHELETPCTNMKDCLNRAKYCNIKGRYDKTKEYYLLASELAKTATNAEKESYYADYADYLYDNKDYKGAAAYYRLAADTHKLENGEDTRWTLLTFWTALTYDLMRDFETAYDEYSKVLPKFKQQGDESHARWTMSSMGNCLYFLKKYKEAKAMFESELEAFPTDPNSAEYAKVMANIAKAERRMGNYGEAIANLNKAADIYKSLNMDIELRTVLVDLSKLMELDGRDGAEDLIAAADSAGLAVTKRIYESELENLPQYKLAFGEESILYANSLGIIANGEFELVDRKQGLKRYREFLDAERRALRRAFVFQNENERFATWDANSDHRDDLIAKIADFDVINEGLSGEVNAMAYDLALLSKGMMLNSSIEFSKVVENGGNARAKEIFSQAKAQKAKIERMENGEEAASLEDLSDARAQYDRLLYELVSECPELSDFTSYIDYTWLDVQKALGEGDAAIEFVEINTTDPRTLNLIAAIVLKKGMATPQAVPVCIRHDAQAMLRDTLALTKEKYAEIVWKNIYPLVKDCSSIYFSPDVEISSLAIEYMPYQGKPMIDRFDIFRLSSTKELCRSRAAAPIREAALFGGIDYDMAGASAAVKPERSGQRSGAVSFGKLKGAEAEVEAIKRLMERSKGCRAQLFKGAQASEQTFKSLSGKGMDVIHVATHGAYRGGDRISEKEAMANSILAMSGCNVPVSDGANDGYLTAQDVAQMNLHNCQLAVLSACDTGLGLLSTDGVFGLQRGFKNAGVGTLLMSLHKVDDAITKELMTQFYASLMAGKSPNASLREAQNYLRNNGCDNPRLWGAFIILDGK